MLGFDSLFLHNKASIAQLVEHRTEASGERVQVLFEAFIFKLNNREGTHNW